MNWKRVYRAPESDKGAGSGQPAPANDAASMAEARAKAAEERLAKIEADTKAAKDKAADDAKKAADAKAIEDGKIKEVLTQKEAELAAAAAKAAALEEKEKARAEKLFARLPEASKKRAEVLKGKLSVADFAEYLDQEIESAGDVGKPNDFAPPPAGGRTPGGRQKPTGVELRPESERVLQDVLSVDSTAMKTLAVRSDGPEGQRRWLLPFMNLKKRMTATRRASRDDG